MIIRQASPQDLQFITHLAKAFDVFGPYVPVFVNMLNGNRAALQAQGVIGEVELFIHEDNAGERTGFVAVEWKNGGIGDIHGVAVDQRHRRQGVANHLLDHVEQLARLRGTLKLECITAETENAPALSCFIQWGFQNLGFVGRNYPNGQRPVKLSRTLNRQAMSVINILHAAHPLPPPDVAVGRIPIDYLNRLPAAAIHKASVAGHPAATVAPLTRSALRAICIDPAVTPLAKYACIMAWGGQHFGNFDKSCGDPALKPLILALLASANNRQSDFLVTQAAAAFIPGLGISFYTKLLFFLRPVQDAYILDQWTAKSLLLLQFPPVIRLMRRSEGYNQADPDTTQAEYECFCKAVEGLRGSLWPVGLPTTGEQVEMAMFDRSRPDGFWRAFVRINFDHPRAGKLLVNGGESLTQAHDYRCGLLVIRRIDPPRLFVIGIHGSCCHWSSDDCYRLLLARLRELLAQHKLPITLVLPPGPCPQWFTDALKALGITVETSNWSDESASAGVDTDDDDKELLDATQQGSKATECPSEAGSKKTQMPKTMHPTPPAPPPMAAAAAPAPAGEDSLPDRVARAHAAAYRADVLPGASPNVRPTRPDQPVRVHCERLNGVDWQYAFQENSIHAEVFFPADNIALYDDLRRVLGVANHDFGQGILGNGDNNGITRSIRLTITQGLNAPQNQWDEIARQAVTAMVTLFARVSEII